MKDSAKTLALLLASAAAGVAIGMLLAPDSGAETRKKIMKSSRRLAESLKRTAGTPLRKLHRLEKEKRDREEFMANVHSESNPLGMA